MQRKVNHKKHTETKFVPEVGPTTKVAYIPIEEPTKGRISFNHNPPKLPPRPTRFFTINLHEDEGNTIFLGLNHNPWELSGDT
jgi:hypothetical protein